MLRIRSHTHKHVHHSQRVVVGDWTGNFTQGSSLVGVFAIFRAQAQTPQQPFVVGAFRLRLSCTHGREHMLWVWPCTLSLLVVSYAQVWNASFIPWGCVARKGVKPTQTTERLPTDPFQSIGLENWCMRLAGFGQLVQRSRIPCTLGALSIDEHMTVPKAMRHKRHFHNNL